MIWRFADCFHGDTGCDRDLGYLDARCMQPAGSRYTLSSFETIPRPPKVPILLTAIYPDVRPRYFVLVRRLGGHSG